NVTCNARMGSRELKAFCALDEATLELLKMAMNELKLSARAYDRILKVARTIADLAGAERLTSEHISEAIQYRSLDRQLWAARGSKHLPSRLLSQVSAEARSRAHSRRHTGVSWWALAETIPRKLPRRWRSCAARIGTLFTSMCAARATMSTTRRI